MATNGKFEYVDSPKLAMVHICHDGDVIWGCTEHSEVYFCPRLFGEWQFVPGRRMQWVTCSAGGRHVYGCTPEGKCFYRAGGIKGEWKQIPGCMDRIAVSANGKHVWGVLLRNHTLFYRAGHDRWVFVSGLEVDVLSVSAEGDTVWVAGPDGNLSVRTDGAKEAFEWADSWYWHEAPELANAKDVCVADVGIVWAVDKENNFYQQFWLGKQRIWEKQNKKLAQLSVSAGGEILIGLDTEGYTWCYDYADKLWRVDNGMSYSPSG